MNGCYNIFIRTMEIYREAAELINFTKSPLYHRPEYNIDGGIEMVFIMKRIKN